MRSIAMTLGLLLSATVVGAQAAPPADKQAALKQLTQIEDDIARANRDCDYAYFRRIEADEFIFTGANGAVTTRAEDLAGEKDCRKTDYTTVIDEPRLSFYGTFAVLSARSSVTTKDKDGKPVTRRTRFTDVFIWRDARWQLVAGHSSRIPDERALPAAKPPSHH
jgi:ketosteroid isomerase-like protein